MRRLGIVLLALLLALGWAGACAEERDSFVVVEEDDGGDLLPDPRRQARVLMRSMTAQEKVYQLFFVAPEALTGESYTTALGGSNVFARYPVGGVVLFGQNIVSEAQLKTFTSQMQEQARQAEVYPLFLAVSEEGGAHSRVAGKLGYPPAPSAARIGQTGDGEAARQAGRAIADYLRPLGINMDFAPVADVDVAEKNGLGERSYGADADQVSGMAFAMAEGLRQGGVIPCYLHFPGQGSVNGDLNKGSASILSTEDEMRRREWAPFRAGIEGGIEMVMVSHGVARSLGDGLPACLSSLVVNGFLRGELGYDGVVVTDSLRMKAITESYKPGPAAVRALQAGADMLLLPEDLDAAAHAVLKALDTGEMTLERIDASVERILALKIMRGLIQ